MNTQSKIPCNPCQYNGDVIKATVYCSSCHEHLCFNCERAHRGLKLTRDHNLETIKDTPPVVKKEPVSPTCEGADGETIGTTMVPRINYTIRRFHPYDTHIELECSNKREENRAFTPTALCGTSQNNEKKVTRCETSDDDQGPSLQHCQVHNTKVVSHYCENHKKLTCALCNYASHRECETTRLPCTSKIMEIHRNTAMTTAEPNTKETIDAQKTSEHEEVTGTSKDALLEMIVNKDRRIDIDMGIDLIYISCSLFLQNGNLVVLNDTGHILMQYDSNFMLISILRNVSPNNFFPLFTRDMCSLSETEIAFTEPDLQRIQRVTTEPILRYGHAIKVGYHCYSIDSYLDMLYAITVDMTNGKNGILVIAKDGQKHRWFDLSNDKRFLFKRPRRIRVSRTSGRMFVADISTNTVTCLTQSGDVVYTYKHMSLCEPTDIYVDSQDIFVSGYISNNVHRVDKDGKFHSILISKNDGVNCLRSLSYRVRDGALVIGMNVTCNPNIKVFWLQK